jgi:hypothetical protein
LIRLNIGKGIYELFEDAEKQQNMLSNKNSKDISRPNIASNKPTYTTKAPKK